MSRHYVLMADRYRTADGWTVETVRLSMTPDRHDGEWIRVRRFGFWIQDVRSVEELAQLVPLADLEPYGLELPACRFQIPNLCPGRLPGMSDSIVKRGRGGRPSKGPRGQLTVRCAEPLVVAIESARADSGLTTNDFVVGLIEKALAAGLLPSAEAPGQDRLPLSA
jgi:hypothetical protein